jgi:hypothetical protein
MHDARLSPYEKALGLAVLAYLAIQTIGALVTAFDLLTLCVCLLACAGMGWILLQIWLCPNLVQPDDEQV